jgi:hypothetical protein
MRVSKQLCLERSRSRLTALTASQSNDLSVFLQLRDQLVALSYHVVVSTHGQSQFLVQCNTRRFKLTVCSCRQHAEFQ